MQIQKTKIVALFIALVMAFSLAACSGNTDKKNDSTNQPDNTNPSGGTSQTDTPSDGSVEIAAYINAINKKEWENAVQA